MAREGWRLGRNGRATLKPAQYAIGRGAVIMFSAFAALNCSSDRRSDEAAVGAVRQALQATQATVTVSVSGETGLHDVALGASDSMRVGPGVHVTSVSGSVASISNTGSAQTELHATSVVDGDVVSVGQVALYDNAHVDGSLTTAATVVPQPNNGTVGEPPIVENATLDPSTIYTWTVDFPASSLVYTLNSGDTQSPPPGAYADVILNSGATLNLTAGTYYFDSLMANSASTVNIDMSTGPTVVYVRGSLTFRPDLNVSGGSRDLLIVVLGPYMSTVESPFTGTIVAPNGTLRLGPLNGGPHEGSFFGKRVEVEANTPVLHAPFGHWDVILPPELIVECLTRTAAGYGAGVFGYVNPLDIPVELPEGPRNWLSDTRLHKGPLETFEPGEHRDAYSIPFRGDALEWTLSGNGVRVDNEVDRCTFDHYTVVEGDVHDPLKPLPQGLAALAVPLAPSPEFVPIEETQPPADLGDLLQAAVGGIVDAAGDVPAVEDNSGINLLITSVGFHDEDSCTVGTVDIDLNIQTYVATPYYQNETLNVFEESWDFFDFIDQFLVFPGLADLFSAKVKQVAHTVFLPIDDDQSPIPVRFDLMEVDDNFLCSTEHFAVFDFEIDPVTLNIAGTITGDNPQWYQVTPTAEILPPEGDLNRPLHCGRGDYGWGVCFQLIPAPPQKLCADFPAQYLDAAGGEDHLASTDVRRVPASFAKVTVKVVGGQEPFTPQEVVLDKDGCVPEEYAPSVAQLTPAGSDFSVTFTWHGVLSAPVEDGGDVTIEIDRLPGKLADAWTACGLTGVPFECTPSGDKCALPAGSSPVCAGSGYYPQPCPSGGGTPGTLCYQAASSDHTVVEGSWTGGDQRASLGTTDPNAPTVFSNTGAIMAHLLRLQVAEDVDMGIVAGTFQIWPESVPAFFNRTPYHGAGGRVHARPEWTSVEPNMSPLKHESDSARKHTIVHELTHAMQARAAGDVGNGAYA